MKINTEIHEHQHEHEEHSHAGADHVYTHDTGHSHDHAHTYDAAHPHDHAHTHGHKHVHTAAEKKAVINRLSKAIGHLEAVKRMVEKDEDCSEVLIQLAAVRSAINNTGKVVLKNHMNHCIVEAVEENDEEAIKLLNQAIDKFIK
ncbi:MAG: metal-sensing transcriptional repressor [Faecalicatena sp.]|uniref:metal-sensing transcriptional repressor n=1 Tax=Faecalicatena sp. TaxID=2005360 RepID=UPI00258DD873|nr:metal-sensing transcriptional repressor [Faecalicatena sp.]MCI6466276.1 metal-sensing transcriptional repressor [Faecalicatena sp.]MDY5617718.1 metal-sensing transcriptional repressor [Lachnospiraceae bacterium]